MSSNSLAELMAANAAFEFPSQFCLAGAAGRSTVCFHNFYDQVFRDADVPVDLHVFGFGPQGEAAGAVRRSLGTGEAVQIFSEDLGMAEPGLVAVAALPRFDLARLAAGKIRLKRRIGTGFYMIWQDAGGHVDTMHEWLGVGTQPLGARRYHVVFDHAGGRLARRGLVLMCPTLREGSGAARLTVYTARGRVLGSSDSEALPPMGSRIVDLDERFPRFAEWLAAEGALGVRLDCTNLVEPLSLERSRSGDFHLQHIN
jgi:hypothetical protein